MRVDDGGRARRDVNIDRCSIGFAARTPGRVVWWHNTHNADRTHDCKARNFKPRVISSRAYIAWIMFFVSFSIDTRSQRSGNSATQNTTFHHFSANEDKSRFDWNFNEIRIEFKFFLCSHSFYSFQREHTICRVVRHRHKKFRFFEEKNWLNIHICSHCCGMRLQYHISTTWFSSHIGFFPLFRMFVCLPSPSFSSKSDLVRWKNNWIHRITEFLQLNTYLQVEEKDTKNVRIYAMKGSEYQNRIIAESLSLLPVYFLPFLRICNPKKCVILEFNDEFNDKEMSTEASNSMSLIRFERYNDDELRHNLAQIFIIESTSRRMTMCIVCFESTTMIVRLQWRVKNLISWVTIFFLVRPFGEREWIVLVSIYTQRRWLLTNFDFFSLSSSVSFCALAQHVYINDHEEAKRFDCVCGLHLFTS